MRRTYGSLLLVAWAVGLLAAGGSPARAGCHTWDVSEIFSNADGTIQFIELRETNGGCCEDGISGHNIDTGKRTYQIPGPDLDLPTAFRNLLFGTAEFAALPGAPTPDYIIANNFFYLDGDFVRYTPYDTMTFGPGELPTDGIQSLVPLAFGNLVDNNSPTNYAGETGMVDAGTDVSPPPVPDGSGNTLPMTVEMLDADGTILSLSWDVSFCAAASDHLLIYGQGSQLPSLPAGPFQVEGGVCGLGALVPFVWNGVPEVTDGTGLLWWLLLVDGGDGSEGSWGTDGSQLERLGPGLGGSSELCGISFKDASNTCSG